MPSASIRTTCTVSATKIVNVHFFGEQLQLNRHISHMANRFTDKQGQYLAFIYNYSVMFGQPPAESDLQRFFGSSPPTIHQMVVKLAERRLISRSPGEARSIELLVHPDEIPRLVRPKSR